MRHPKISGHPEGATWKAKDKKRGLLFTIWLGEIKQTFEVWHWSETYSDGSGYKGDWGTSYQSVRNQCLTEAKFKRVE